MVTPVMVICHGDICHGDHMSWWYIMMICHGAITHMSWRYVMNICHHIGCNMSYVYVMGVCHEHMSLVYVIDEYHVGYVHTF